MAKSIGTMVLDAALNYIDANCNLMTLCAGQPTTYTQAATTNKLADVVMAGADFTLAAGDTSGRKVTSTAKNAVPVDTAGTSDHCTWCNSTGSELLAVTTHTSTALAAAGTVDIGAWKYEINNPT
jgi:hypothetical protein